MLQQGQVSFKILCKLALLFSLMAGLEKRSHKNHHEKRSRYTGATEFFFIVRNISHAFLDWNQTSNQVKF